MVTVTSSNGTVIGASGLCTVTSTSCTGSCFRHWSAIRWARVSISSTGSPHDDRGDLLGHDAVVRRAGQVVARGGGTGVQEQHQVDREGLALSPLTLENTVVAAGTQAPQSDAVQQTNHCSKSDGPHPDENGGQGGDGRRARR